MKVLTKEKRIMAVAAEVEKRDGIYVSRKLLPHSAKKWHEWGTKHGIPGLLPAEEMHVTVIFSSVDAKVPLLETTLNIETTGVDAYRSGCFAMFGEKEDHLVFAMSCWELHDRHWVFCTHGAVTTWTNYRPHLTISDAALGYELPDEALSDVPRWIVLGPETAEAPKLKSVAKQSDSLIEVSDALKTAAAEVLKAQGDKMSTIDAYDLADISKGRLGQAVANRLAAEDWAPAELKEKAVVAPTIIEVNGRKFIEKDVKMTVGAIPEEIRKRAGKIIDAFKTNEEERLAYGWASVSTVKGEFVEDLQGDTITTKAQRQWLHSLIRSQRIGKMEHEGDQIGEVVEGIVLDKSMQDALGIDLGMEGCLVGTHYTCEKTWDMVKTGNWMYSIAGRVLIEVAEQEPN